MEKFWQTLFLIVILAMQGHSFVDAQSFDGGLKTGLTASEVAGDNLAGPDKTGFFASVFTLYPVSSSGNLRLEIMYIEKGSRAKPSEENNFFDYRFALQYLEMPVIWEQELPSFTSLKHLNDLKIYGGLSGAFLVNAREEENGASILTPERENFKNAELNILTGISFPLSSSIEAVFGFSNALTPIRPHASGGKTWIDRGQYHSLWSLGLSYTFW
ncbi:MAG: outer membrane beta-barrel protein [Bacteroidota bacterium]